MYVDGYYDPAFSYDITEMQLVEYELQRKEVESVAAIVLSIAATILGLVGTIISKDPFFIVISFIAMCLGLLAAANLKIASDQQRETNSFLEQARRAPQANLYPIR